MAKTYRQPMVKNKKGVMTEQDKKRLEQLIRRSKRKRAINKAKDIAKGAAKAGVKAGKELLTADYNRMKKLQDKGIETLTIKQNKKKKNIAMRARAE